MSTRQAIQVHPKDNVVTALEALPEGIQVVVEGTGGEANQKITLQEAIAFGHKFAIEAIAKGSPVIKYGETIGLATQPIRAGEWVHVHNIESTRGRGDLAPSRGAA
jgi:altronate dehydratase small subunit